jgi:hypothetical protein
MALESGSLERLFWRQVPTEREPLLDALARVPPETPVWFVGHSLGGALATLAFAAWRNRCEHLSKQADGGPEAARFPNARLVTFASPLVGDAHAQSRADPRKAVNQDANEGPVAKPTTVSAGMLSTSWRAS